MNRKENQLAQQLPDDITIQPTGCHYPNPRPAKAMSEKCNWNLLNPNEPRCTNEATTRWGGVPFCNEHAGIRAKSTAPEEFAGSLGPDSDALLSDKSSPRESSTPAPEAYSKVYDTCPECGGDMSVNWRDGKPYDYCPDHGEPEDANEVDPAPITPILRSKPVSLMAWAKKACPACRGMWSQYGSHGKKWVGYKCPSDDCKGSVQDKDRNCSHCGRAVDHNEEPDICRSCIAEWFSDSKQNSPAQGRD